MSAELHPLSEAALAAGIDRLAAVDEDVARALARIGYPAPRQRDPGFATLLRIMVAQQLSTRSAAAIWARVEAGLPAAGDAPRAFSRSTRRRSRRSASAGRRWPMAAGSPRRSPPACSTSRRWRRCPRRRRSRRSRRSRGSGAGAPRFISCSRSAAPTSFRPTISGCRSACSGSRGSPRGRSARPWRQLAEPWRPWRGCGAIFLWHYYGSATLDEAAAVRRA